MCKQEKQLLYASTGLRGYVNGKDSLRLLCELAGLVPFALVSLSQAFLEYFQDKLPDSGCYEQKALKREIDHWL